MPPGRNSHSPSTSVPAPFLLLCCPVGRGTASHGIRPTSPRSRTRLLVSPSLLLLLGRLSARPPLFSLPDAPFSCPQLDAFSISLNVPSPVVRRTRPPTWLALGLDQGPSSLLPRGTSFGRSVQPRPPFFRRGRRSDLSARGRVPPIPEVPERVLVPNSFKRLHIHAVPSSSMPARPSLDTSPDDPHALLRAACPVSGARQLVLYPTPW